MCILETAVAILHRWKRRQDVIFFLRGTHVARPAAANPRKKAGRYTFDSGRPLRLAEQVGFEPTVRHNRTPDFESGAFDHSATAPDSVRVVRSP
jgi:hypothetical protein